MYSSELSALGIECKGHISGKVKTKCPKCSGDHKKANRKDLFVDIDTGVYRCYSEKCQWKGSVANAKKYSRPVFNNKTDITDKIVKYFEGRRISQKTLKKLKVTSTSGMITFNYFRNDVLINTKSRTLDKSRMFQHKDAQKIPYNIDSIKGKKKVIFTEGEPDTLSFVEADLDAEYGIISLDQGAGSKGSSLEGKLACLKACANELNEVEEFYLAFDDDDPGQWTLKEVARRLGEYRCKKVLFKGCKDANELLCSSTMDKNAAIISLQNCIKEAKPIPIEGVITLDEGVRAELIRQYREGREKGVEIGIDAMDRHIKFAKDEFTVITGFANCGKGTVTKFMSVKLAVNHGWKFAIYAPEDFPVIEYYEDICHMYIGNTLDKEVEDRATEADLMVAMDFVEQHYFLVHPEPDKKTGKIALPTLDWVFDKFKFLKLAMGVNACIIDPWNKLSHQMTNTTIDMYLADALSQLKFYCKGWDHCFLIAHQKAPETTKKHVKPVMYRISGGAMWANMADNIIAIDRKTKDDKDTESTIIIEKIKKQKVNGKIGQFPLYLDKKSNRFTDTAMDFDLPANHEGMMKSLSAEILDLPF